MVGIGAQYCEWSTSVGLIHVSLFYTLESFKAGSFSQNNIISRLISFCALDNIA